ncbi:hypothetical protein GQ53DRAFT_715066 [Thozetella sp. PMI_491]|nr:hypothetical protein GQ53DRAFT_715066 [Thozetella sp. PMI_491]
MDRNADTLARHGGPQPHVVISTRSCTECCRRKVRCDRALPCTNCIRARSECVFPTARRPPTRSRHPRRNEEVLTYLRKLEDRLDARARQELETAPADAAGTSTRDPAPGAERRPVSPGSCGRHTSGYERPTDSPAGERDEQHDEPARLELVHDRSRYISNNFWSGMAREIEEMRDILDASSSEPDDEPPLSARGSGDASTSPAAHYDSFMFGPAVTANTLQSFHPPPPHLLSMFDIFLENVDPVVRIFHRATLRSTVQEALPRLHDLDRPTEVVLFSLYYAALTSLDDFDCRRIFEEDRDVLLTRYRFAVEQSLARARFLHSPNLAVLAAMVLFLVCVRRHDNSLFVSSLLGVVIRSAQNMGLHRDGTNFRLPPFQVEMRRRLWWQICVLDIRASEDHGSDPTIFPSTYDTQFPANINDDDIAPTDTAPPLARPGASDMTFCLLRFEVCVSVRRLHYHAPGGDGRPAMTAAEKHAMVQSLERHFQERYISHCDITKPFEWVSATWAQLMLTKMWLAVHTPSPGSRDGASQNVPVHVRNLALEKSIEVLEISDVLETAPRAARWAWLFLTHVQWHAVVFVLAYLCVSPDAPLARRAWLVIDKVYRRWSSTIQARKGMLWKPVRQLMRRATRLRSGTTKRGASPSAGDTPLSSSSGPLAGTTVAATSLVVAGHPVHAGGVPLGSAVYSTPFGTYLAGPHEGVGSYSAPGPSHTDLLPDTRMDLASVRPDPKPAPSRDGTAVDSGLPDLHGGFGAEAEPSDPSAVWSDWDTVMQGLQIDFTQAPDLSDADFSREVHGYMRNLWNTL